MAGKTIKSETGPYTRLSWHQIRGLTEAGASSNERAVYEVMTAFHSDVKHPHRVTGGGRRIASLTGIRHDSARRAIQGLTKKLFTSVDNKPTPILTRATDGGGEGNAATYEDNLYHDALEAEQQRLKEEAESVAEPPHNTEGFDF